MTRDLNLFDEKVSRTESTSAHNRSQEIRRILEALLFASSEPIPLMKLKEIIEESFPIAPQELLRQLEALREAYQRERRGFHLEEIGEGFLLRTPEDLKEHVQRLLYDRRSEKLSKAALEVLSLIAFKQPITRSEIEKIRGSDSSGVLSALIERGLVVSKGQLEAPGRPQLYGTTRKFLTHFGLKDIMELENSTSANYSLETKM